MPLRAETNEVSTNAVATVVVPSTEPEAKPASAPASGPLDFSSFKMVSERNIFNGNRSGQRMTATRSSTQQRSVRVESFSLVGTLLSEEKEPVAFFDGSSSELRKALKAGGSIAGFTVKEILHAGVRLASGTNITEVLVGSGLRREDAGLWKASTVSTSYASSSVGGSSGGGDASSDNGGGGRSSGRGGRNGRGDSGSSASSPASGASSTDAAEILKRLMEKREKE